MKRFTSIILLIAALFLLVTVAGAAEETISVNGVQAVQVAVGNDMVFNSVIAETPEIAYNYSKLEIAPSYAQFTLKPGESKETTVIVRNRDSKAVALKPEVQSLPYSGVYQLENDWMEIKPADAVLDAGESVKFTIKVTAPDDAFSGYYNAVIAFTDEQYPSAYPLPLPNYIHQMGVSATIVSPAAIQASTPHISDSVEAGKDYRYSVEIKNTGNTAVQLNPEIGSDGYVMVSSYGPMEPPLSASDFTLNAPSMIMPGETATLDLALKVAADVSGYYNGYIDLGIHDPSIMTGEGRIMLNFNIWKQPDLPYTRQFTLDNEGTIKVELTSGTSAYMAQMLSGVTSETPVPEPSFDTVLTGPGGNVDIVPVSKVIRGSVSFGANNMYGAFPEAGTYQEMNTQYIVTYAASGTPGEWHLSVMPRNTPGFEYSITIE